MDRFPSLAKELVELNPDVLFVVTTLATRAAQAATATIPIVFIGVGDPVGLGLVPNLARPGGNITGITIFGPAAVTKRVQLMHELVPQATTIAYLMNPNHPSGEIEMRAAQTAARSLGKEMLVLKASNEREFDPARNSKSVRSSSPQTRSSIRGAASSSRW